MASEPESGTLGDNPLCSACRFAVAPDWACALILRQKLDLLWAEGPCNLDSWLNTAAEDVLNAAPGDDQALDLARRVRERVLTMPDRFPGQALQFLNRTQEWLRAALKREFEKSRVAVPNAAPSLANTRIRVVTQVFEALALGSVEELRALRLLQRVYRDRCGVEGVAAELDLPEVEVRSLLRQALEQFSMVAARLAPGEDWRTWLKDGAGLSKTLSRTP